MDILPYRSSDRMTFLLVEGGSAFHHFLFLPTADLHFTFGADPKGLVIAGSKNWEGIQWAAARIRNRLFCKVNGWLDIPLYYYSGGGKFFALLFSAFHVPTDKIYLLKHTHLLNMEFFRIGMILKTSCCSEP